MAAKGSTSKDEIGQKILNMFEGAFKYDKEIRIPMMEDGVEVQIKVTLTCAKENVSNPNGDSATPAADHMEKTVTSFGEPDENGIAQISESEQQLAEDMLKRLGF